jgi:hypothetical protein
MIAIITGITTKTDGMIAQSATSIATDRKRHVLTKVLVSKGFRVCGSVRNQASAPTSRPTPPASQTGKPERKRP